LIRQFIARLEKVVSHSRWLSALYIAPYKKVLDREIAIANVDSDDVVLNIGCGAIPFTAILLAQKTDAFVYAIDRDLRAVKAAQRVVGKYQLQDRIKVVLHDAVEPFSHDVTLAFLSLQAQPKAKIVDVLKETMRPFRLLARIPAQRYQRFYDAFPEMEAKKNAFHNMKAFEKTLYIEE